MENNLPLHFSMFNTKVKIMNQNNEKSLTLSATEARNLHADIFDTLNYLAIISRKNKEDNKVSELNVNMDGGNF